MKTILKPLFIFQILILTLKSFAVPLNGAYTIGATGHFPTIGSAVNAVINEGVSGPVTFKIQSGTYPGVDIFYPFPNANSNQTVTFESLAGNPDSVTIYGNIASFNIGNISFLVLQNLTLQNVLITDVCSDIVITGNKFLSDSIGTGIQMESGNITNFKVNYNSGLPVISNDLGYRISNMQIIGNSFMPGNSNVSLFLVDNLEFYQNTGIGSLTINSSTYIILTGNKLNAVNPTSYPFRILSCVHSIITNNFISSDPGSSTALFHGNFDLKCINNTFQTHGLDTTIICTNNYSPRLQFNIYDNDSGGYSVSYKGNSALSSDLNTYNNGGASDLISYNGTAYTLSAFQTHIHQDLHSVLKNVNFVSSSDLHLHASHIGDPDLFGAPDPLVTVDIDGQLRSALHPYKGADEPDTPLPVELSSFTASAGGNNVLLMWTTLSEHNNSGFDVERSSVRNEWNKIAFINGLNNSNTPNNYSYEDKNLNSGKYKYRLRQIDYNGNFVYYNLSGEIEIGVPAQFGLRQNYPNPFNPETNIIFDIPSDQLVKLNVYDISGRMITQLVNEVRTAGTYSVKFNAGNVSSGIYFYVITAGNFSDTKKMIIMK